jgi:hypothetical protein
VTNRQRRTPLDVDGEIHGTVVDNYGCTVMDELLRAFEGVKTTS